MALVIANLADQIDQDRGKSRETCPLHLFPDGGGVDLPEYFRGHSETNTAIDATSAGVTIQACW